MLNRMIPEPVPAALREESESHCGVAVAGYVYHMVPWRVTFGCRSTASTGGGYHCPRPELNPGRRGRRWPPGFYVPVSAHAAMYRPTVHRLDKVILEGPAPQGPLTDAHGS